MADQQPLHGSVVVRLQRDLFMKRTFIHNLKTKAAWLEKGRLFSFTTLRFAIFLEETFTVRTRPRS